MRNARIAGARGWTGGVVVLAMAAIAAGCGAPGVALPPMTAYTVSGTLTAADGSPLASASIVLGGSPRGALADADGRFSISGVYPGAYAITVLHLGFRSEEHPLRISGAGDDSFPVAMHRDPSLDQGLDKAIPDSMDPVTVTLEVRPGS